MRIVLDTNVLVSGLLRADGPPGRVMDMVLAGRITCLCDDRIIEEYRDVLSRPRFDFDSARAETVLSYIEAASERVLSTPLAVNLPDPDDVPFLEVAVAGGADCIVTGNAAHFRASSGLAVVKSPRAIILELGSAGLDDPK